jgi:hypothetical protein
VSCRRRHRRRRRFVCKTFEEKKGRKMCCVRAGTFEILHHLSLSLFHLFPAMFLHPTMEEESWNTQAFPTHQKQNQKTNKNYTKKNHTINKSQTDPFSFSSGSIQFQEIFPKRCSNVT